MSGKSQRKSGAPLGNSNARRGTEWRNALASVLKKYKNDRVKRGKALEVIAYKVVELALAGDKDAIQEVGNRLDGKPTQTVLGDGMSFNFTLLPYDDGTRRPAGLTIDGEQIFHALGKDEHHG